MNKQYLKKLDKAEDARVASALNNQKIRDPDDLDFEPIFRNETVFKEIGGGGNPILAGYNHSILPSVSMFYDRILLQVCQACPCAKQPNLIEPYLERGLVIPILPGSYVYYPPDFVDTILRYPHISSAEFEIFRTYSLFRQENTYICPHCRERERTKYLPALNRLLPGSEFKAQISSALIDASPFLPSELVLVDEMRRQLAAKDKRRLLAVLSLIRSVGFFRTAQAFSAIPQVSLSEVERLEKASKVDPEAITGEYEIMDIRNSVLNGLRLAYNPAIPVDTYLDIIEPRRRTISHIVTDMIAKSKPSSQEFLSNLQSEVEHVNSEVRDIKSSKRTKMFGLTTGFLSQNKEIIAGCLGGAITGLKEFGIIGCASGSLMGSLGLGALKKLGQIKVPAEATEMKRMIFEGLEPSIEKFLSFYLSRDLTAVQVWQLQRKISAS
jgi:hypothetical protein